MKFVIEGELGTLNEYIAKINESRHSGNKEKKEWTRFCMLQLYNQRKIGSITKKSDFIFVWYRKNDNTDHDNVCFAKKYVFDGMVDARILPDDRSKYVGNFFDYFEVDKKNPRVEIEVIEREG